MGKSKEQFMELTEMERFLENNKDLDDSILVEHLKQKVLMQERLIQNKDSQIDTLTRLKDNYFNQKNEFESKTHSLTIELMDLKASQIEGCGRDKYLENKPVNE